MARSNTSVATVVSKDATILAAHEELSTLEKLSQYVLAKISELTSRRPVFDSRNSSAEVSIHEANYSSLKSHEELAQNCYGRTVIGAEVDNSGNSKRPFSYRITQANVGFIEDGCNVLARNSLVASKLVTTSPGEEAEISARSGTRFLQVKEVRTFDHPTSLLSISQKPNFRLMSIRLLGRAEQSLVKNLRLFVEGAAERSEPDLRQKTPQRAPASQVMPPDDPTWMVSWEDVSLGDSDSSSLGHQFFTRTTAKQEGALNKPRGLTFVEGIAGSGKTSIALGRLKFFANFSTGEHREDYSLKDAGQADFSPSNMVGFVLSHSLKSYLKETASALQIGQLPIQDFQEFRADLSNRFGIARAFKRSQSQAPIFRTQLAWLLAIDTAMSRAAGERLRRVAVDDPKIPKAVQSVVIKMADAMAVCDVEEGQLNFHLLGLADRVVSAVMEAEFRAQEVEIRARMAKEKDRNAREEMRLELDRIAKEEDRNGISELGRRLLSELTVSDLIADVARMQDTPDIVRRAFNTRGIPFNEEIDDSVRSFGALVLGDARSRNRSLTDADVAALAALAAIIADGFDRGGAPNYLYQVRRRTAVFIDEVQDFTEVEILLMGMAVTSAYHQITLSGDRQQRLQLGGAEEYRDLFPFVPRSRQNMQVFLDHNFRQREVLSALSAEVRSVFQGDLNSSPALKHSKVAAAVHTFKSNEEMAALIVERLLTVDAYATVAVIMPSEIEARRWYDLMRDDLAAYHRPALLSHRDDLTRRNDIHFTEVREAKGLEFDVVIVPDISVFDLSTVIGRNQFYVAISRPRHALLLGCQEAEKGDEYVGILVKEGAIVWRPIVSR